MRTVTIREPYWKYRAFGVGSHLINEDGVQVKCSYKNKQGELAFPHIYYISKESILKGEYNNHIARGTKLIIIPINDFQIKEKETV